MTRFLIRILAIFVGGGQAVCPAAEPELAVQLRQPVGMAMAEDELLVANRKSGSLSLIDPGRLQLVGEVRVGGRPSDLAVTADGRRLLVTDEERNRLVLLERDSATWEAVQELPVPTAPVTVRISPDGTFASVASLWARRLTFVSLSADHDSRGSMHTVATVDLPFAPREQCFISGGSRLIVADSFGGQVAIIDPASRALQFVLTFDGHNIRGLAADEESRELLISHQLLNAHVSTTRERIFWGSVVSNLLKSVSYDEFIEPRTEGEPTTRRLAHWSLYPLGTPSRGAGDPAKIHMTSGGRSLVLLGGVDQVALRSAPSKPFLTHAVGSRPAAIAVDRDERHAFIANTFDDTVSVLRLEDPAVVGTIALGPRPEPDAVARGERLFHDARLSLDGWYSCQSCHTDGHTNGLSSDNLGDGSFGDAKKIPTLLGNGATAPWAWNGSKPHLEEQIRSSVETTMRGNADLLTAEEIESLKVYLQSLPPAPALSVARKELTKHVVERGSRVFQRQGCTACHTPASFTSSSTFDVGLYDRTGTKRFNPPALTGVNQRPPYLHDGRAATLRDVLLEYNHGDAADIPFEELEALIEFLDSL